MRCSTSVGTWIAGKNSSQSIAYPICITTRADPGLAAERAKRRYACFVSSSVTRLGAQNDTLTPSVPHSRSTRSRAASCVGASRASQPGVGLEAAEGPVEDEAERPLGERGGEQPRHRAAADRPEEHGPLGADRVHHGAYLVHPLLERRQLGR